MPALNYEVVERFISRDRALFLLDGLDEVPEQVRRSLVEITAGFRLENKSNRFLLTGRPHGIDTATIQYFGEFLRDIEPLDNEKVMVFVSNWFRGVSGQAVGLADMTAAEMIGDIRGNPHVSVFTQNPLLLTAGKLIRIIESNASLGERFEAGEILGVLGDPRIKEYPMVKVEAGEFTMGGDKYGDEKPIHRVYLDEFMMGKYPVTNEEFKVFVDEGGYNNEEHWTKEGWKWKGKEKISGPRFWYDGKWNRPNFPVVGVSWYEAAAYANWLSKKTGKDYRLPTEAEWEKAARGTYGREYPWGDEFDKNLCNSRECGLNRTSPVGIFPNGKSPYGCMDMAGNVFEWCSDWFDEDYYKKSPKKNPQGPKSGSYRVLRGGRWGVDAPLCRAAFRRCGEPAGRPADVGFRLLRSF